ncbi:MULTISPECIES: hypothetical protein [Photobacterium]|uniref:Uncharacterized protein n=1 Tax=Photobacterium piscicola TaxID=1378299 RepID=A0A1T5HWT9_9GAMM|nr:MULTISPECIES: hypothetical protein [Photobacterium]SKC31321.1 hypothetical protein CZ809_00799 [Photobacterium piscicola]
MAKYQFFCLPHSNREKFTYLDMADKQFITQKQQLLAAGFEIEDDVIFADTSAEAVAHFKSNFIYVMEEYNNSNVITAMINLLICGYKAITNKR